MRKSMMGKLRKISTTYYLRQIVACLLVYCMLLAVPMQVALAVDPPAPGALPSGGTVPVGYGSASFAYDYLNNDLAIGSLATQTVINWDNFDIGSLSSVNFNDAANFAVLNRVTGNTGTTGIYGNLFANGTIFVINTRGIVFGPDSFIQARNFVASGIDIQNDDFMSSIYKFEAFPAVAGHLHSDVIGNVTNEGIGLNHGIDAENVALIGQNVTNLGIIRTTALGGAVIMVAGESVLLSEIGSNVVVQVTMTADPAQRVVDHGGSQGTGPGTIEAPGGKVILAAGDIFSTAISGVDSLAAVANKDITLGNIEAGEITLTADYDDVDGGNVFANGTLTSTTGNIEISASDSTIHINEDVTAEVDLLLNNDTEVAAGKKLEAGRNVDLEVNKVLKALGNLEIVAGTATSAPDGEILAANAIIDMSTGGTLTLTQNNSLDMTSNFNVDNRSNTDLVATSRAGSVTSAQADEWQSITAHAYTDIVLDDDFGGGDVKTKALTADTKDIVVISDLGKVIATEDIIATLGDVSLTADEGIDVTKNITAGGGGDFGGIILDGTVTAVGADDQKFDAEAGTLWAKDTPGRIATITKTGAGKLMLAADTLVDLDGVDGTSGDSVDVQDGALTIDGPVDAEGNLRASGVIHITGPADLAGHVYSTGSGITFDDDVTADGVGDQTFDAGSDWLIAENGADIDKSTAGSLTLAGDLGIELGGNVRGSGLNSSNTITFENNVTADGTGAAEDQVFDADAGALAAAGTITKNDGRDLTLGGGAGIDLDGTVNVLTNRLFIEDDFTAEGDLLSYGYMYIRRTSTPTTGTWVNGEFDGSGNQKVEAGGGLIVNTGEWPESDEPYLEKTTTGNLELLSGSSLSLHAHVTVEEGELIIIGGAPGSSVSLFGNLWSSGDMTLTSNGGGLQLNGNAESRDGSVEMTANGWDIRLYRQSWNYSEPWQGIKADLDIILNDDTAVRYPDATLDAGRDVILAYNKDLRGNGKLTVKAGQDILLGVFNPVNPESGSAGDVSAGYVYPYTGTTTPDSDLILEAGDDVYAHGNLTATGDITATAVDNIHLYATPTSADADGTLTLTAGGDLTVDGALYGNMYLSGYDLTVNGDITSDGPLDIDSDYRVSLYGTVEAQDDITITVEGDDEAYVYAGDTIKSLAGSIDISAVSSDDPSYDVEIDLDGDVEAYGNLSLFADMTDYSAESTYIYTEGLKTLNGEIDVFSDYDMEFNGPVEAHGNMILTAGNDGDAYDNYGDVYAYDTLKSVTGDITINGSYVVELYDAVEAYGNVTIINRQPYWVDCYVESYGSDATITALTGDVSITTDYYMDLEGDIAAQGNITLIADGPVGDPADYDEDGYIYVDAALTTTAGDISISAEYDATVDGIVNSAGTLDVDAGDDIELRADVSSVGVMTMDAGDDIKLNEVSGDTTSNSNMTLTAGKTNIWGDVEAWGTLITTDDENGDLIVRAADNIRLHATTSANAAEELQLLADTDNDPDGGDVVVDGALYGNMTLSGVNVTVYGNVESDGTLDVDADDDIELRANVSSVSVMTMVAGGNIDLNRSSGNTSSDSTIALTAGDEIIIGKAYADNGNVTANGNMTITAGSDWNDDVLVYGKLTTTNGGNIEVRAGDDITIWGTNNGPLYESVDADGALTMSSNISGVGFLGGDLYIAGDTIAESMQLDAGVESPPGLGYSDSRVQVDGLLQTTVGDMVIRAHHDVLLGGDVVSARNLELNADRHGIEHSYHIYGGDVDVAGTVDVFGTIDMYGNNITLQDDVTSGGNMTLTADTSSDFRDPLPQGDVTAMGNLTSTGGNIEIYSDDATTYLGGDRVQAYGNILLNNNTEFISAVDQKVDAQTGMITANGWLWKDTDGSLYLEAAGDVSLFDRVTADFGGVSIISENGMIFSPDDFYDPTDTLNVSISGYSDQGTGAGVKLHPDMDNKAAIVIKSKADLKLGEDAVLTASGTYGDVDDRAAIGFLDDGDPATATIGGILRDEGDPFDVAIYLASTGGDVDVSGPVSITSILDGYLNGNGNGNGNGDDLRPEPIHQGAMVIDAFDSVTFGDLFETSLEDGYVGNRLEVVSRITEWLFQAVGRLPYPYGGFDFPLDYTYVLRGAGLDNPAITDGRRAWVLEDPVLAAPLYEEAGEGAERLTLGLAGCPILVAAVSAELGVPGDTIEVSLANSFALNTDIQPCESCARLLNAATILRDEDGSRMAAMTQMFNDIAPGDSPYTPEMQALIATAFAGAAEESQYATVMQYTDAFVRYLAVLSTEMGSPVADGDSLAFVMGKYGAGVLGSDNSNIAAFVATRLESGETFGN